MSSDFDHSITNPIEVVSPKTEVDSTSIYDVETEMEDNDSDETCWDDYEEPSIYVAKKPKEEESAKVDSPKEEESPAMTTESPDTPRDEDLQPSSAEAKSPSYLELRNEFLRIYGPTSLDLPKEEESVDSPKGKESPAMTTESPNSPLVSPKIEVDSTSIYDVETEMDDNDSDETCWDDYEEPPIYVAIKLKEEESAKVDSPKEEESPAMTTESLDTPRDEDLQPPSAKAKSPSYLELRNEFLRIYGPTSLDLVRFFHLFAGLIGVVSIMIMMSCL